MKEYADIQTQRSIGQIGLDAAVRRKGHQGPVRAALAIIQNSVPARWRYGIFR